MNYVIEDITPAKAQEYLRTSEGNRPISNQVVQSYADTMRRGGWMENGVPIIFDINGHAIDGHHRLQAIAVAGVPVRMSVCRGVSPEVFTTLDCGRHRNLGQLLAMQGVKNYNTTASIVASSETLARTGRIWANNNSGRRTNKENYFLYQRDPEGYNQASDDARRMASVARVLNTSWTGGLIYHLTHKGGYDRDTVVKFFECICSLSDGDIQPANVLRRRILKEKLGNARLETGQLFAFIVLAWNAYVEGRKLPFLRYNPDKEEYPQLILNKQ